MDLVENSSVNSNLKHHPWELARFKIIKENVVNILNLNHKKSNSKQVLVDIGCGDAFVVKKLCNELNFDEVFAVDINFTPENILQLKKDNPTIQYLQHIQQLVPNPENVYVILLNDVLEHIENPIDFLAELNSIFKNVTSFNAYITVPAFSFLFSQHDIDLGHFRRYNITELTAYSKLLGAKATQSGYFFTSLFLIRWIFSIIEKAKSKKEKEKIGVSNWEGGDTITYLFTQLLWMDYKFGKLLRSLKLNLPGLSVFVVIKKTT
jgi:hypothetical protein